VDRDRDRSATLAATQSTSVRVESADEAGMIPAAGGRETRDLQRSSTLLGLNGFTIECIYITIAQTEKK
jgi:hypothetical protein